MQWNYKMPHEYGSHSTVISFVGVLYAIIDPMLAELQYIYWQYEHFRYPTEWGMRNISRGVRLKRQGMKYRQLMYILTNWGRDKMDNISQTTFSNAFSWMKTNAFRLRSHWSLFLRVQLTIFQHWFRWWLGAVQATSHYLNQWWLVYRCIYASLGLNELKVVNSGTVSNYYDFCEAKTDAVTLMIYQSKHINCLPSFVEWYETQQKSIWNLIAGECNITLFTLGTLMASAAVDVINHNGRKIGRFKLRRFG